MRPDRSAPLPVPWDGVHVRLAAKMQEPDNGLCPSADDYAHMTKYTVKSCMEICAVEFALVTSTAPKSLTVRVRVMGCVGNGKESVIIRGSF